MSLVNKSLFCYVHIPGQPEGQRIGKVVFFEVGYYPTNFDNAGLSDEEIDKVVSQLNHDLRIPDDVAQSAGDGSMFGWVVPAAKKAVDFFNAANTCPRCNQKYSQYPSLSRRDNKTSICPRCGDAEALEDASLAPAYSGEPYWKAGK